MYFHNAETKNNPPLPTCWWCVRRPTRLNIAQQDAIDILLIRVSPNIVIIALSS